MSKTSEVKIILHGMDALLAEYTQRRYKFSVWPRRRMRDTVVELLEDLGVPAPTIDEKRGDWVLLTRLNAFDIMNLASVPKYIDTIVSSYLYSPPEELEYLQTIGRMACYSEKSTYSNTSIGGIRPKTDSGKF